MRFRGPIAWRVAAIASGILIVSALHHFTPLEHTHWHTVFHNLYYLPIVLSGLTFGWRGGLAAALFTVVASLPFSLLLFARHSDLAIDQVTEIPQFCAAGLFTGALSERDRRHRAALEESTRRLTAVYQELQDNFEQMKRAERLFALGQLSAGLAHEVRNPLASISGAAGILERNLRLAPREAECLAIIVQECRRLNALVAHFLEFARPREPRFQNADISVLLDSVMELAQHGLGNKSVLLRRDGNNAGTIECDPELLKQVLLNLVINGIQAIPARGEVLVSSKRSEEHLLIQVRDDGKGVAPQDRDRIFDPFFTTKETGTGLGLSVAHKIVEQHGGMLTAESNPDRGMTFSVQLPLHRPGLS